jgi:hypothetical protein
MHPHKIVSYFQTKSPWNLRLRDQEAHLAETRQTGIPAREGVLLSSIHRGGGIEGFSFLLFVSLDVSPFPPHPSVPMGNSGSLRKGG